MEQEKKKMEQGKSKQQRMRELVELLNRARKAYEQDNTEIMSNYEYDRLYDELEELEKELGTKMANSPTVNVGYEVVSGLPKERHERPMLSLDKTKGSRAAERISWHEESDDFLETGRTDHCSHVSGRRTGQSGHKRKWNRGRGHHEQCKGFSECAAAYSVPG